MNLKSRNVAILTVLVLLAVVQIAFSNIKSKDDNGNANLSASNKEPVTTEAAIESETELNASNDIDSDNINKNDDNDETLSAELNVVYRSQLTSSAISQDFSTGMHDNGSIFKDKIVSLTRSRLEVYEKADLAANVVGVMYSGSSADIVKRGEVWTHIISGDVEGYVRNTDILFDDEAQIIAEAVGKRTGTILEDILVYSEADSSSERLSSLAKGAVISAYDECGDYVLIECDNGFGYIDKSAVTIAYGLETAITIEEENRRIAQAEAERAEQAAQEAAAAEAARQEELRRQAEENAKKVAEAMKNHQGSLPVVKRDAYGATDAEIHLLAAIVYWESGWEPAEGQVAVANVVLNRVLSPRFKQNTIESVIYAPGQFTGVADNGKPTERFQGILNMSNEELNRQGCYDAAITALAGNNNIGDLLFFISARKAEIGRYVSYTIINNHCFYVY